MSAPGYDSDSFPPLVIPPSPSHQRGHHTHAATQLSQPAKGYHNPSPTVDSEGQRAAVSNESPRSDLRSEGLTGVSYSAHQQTASSDANGVSAPVSCPHVADAHVADNAEINANTPKIKLQKALLSNKQLLYVKVKQTSFNPLNLAIFKDTTDFQRQFLAQLAAIPALHATGIFKPETLYFSLHKHMHSSARKLKGFLYTACFSFQQADLNLQELILNTQRAQEKKCFFFDLPAFSSSNPKEGPKLYKSKVLFSMDLHTVLDTFMLEFQVKIPPIVSDNPWPGGLDYSHEFF
jgi:hypothetical protein